MNKTTITMNVYKPFSEEGFRDLKIADPLSRERCWKQINCDASIAAEWIPPLVQYLNADEYADPDCPFRREPPRWNGDFPNVAGLPLVLTERSLSVLREILEPHAEFLPLRSAEGDFTAVRILRVIDALDKELSIIDWQHQTKRMKEARLPKTASKVVRYVFRDDLLTEVPIFRVPEFSMCYWFVTEDFRKVVLSAGLRGIGFRPLWPPIEPEIKFAKYIQKHRRKRR